MKDDCRPQQYADKTSREAEVGEIQRDGRAVGQHAEQRRARPAGDRQGNQGDAGHARHGLGDAGQFGAEQQLPDQRRSHQQRRPGRGFGNRSENDYLFQRVYFLPCPFSPWFASLTTLFDPKRCLPSRPIYSNLST